MHSRLGDVYMKLDKLDKALGEYHRFARLKLFSPCSSTPTPATTTTTTAAATTATTSSIQRSANTRGFLDPIH
jgi:hypothetical protein